MELSASGVLSGTPASAGLASFAVTVSDSASPAHTATADMSLTVAAPALKIISSSFPSAQSGILYSEMLTASGGTPGYSWIVASGNLPAGLTISATGLLSGTPTAPGNWSFTVQVTDSGSPAQTAQAVFSLSVAPQALAISTSSLASGRTGVAYSATFAATGGTPGYSWAIASGNLPSGLALSNSGVLSGTPTAAGAASFAVDVTDSETPAQTQQATFSLTIQSNATPGVLPSNSSFVPPVPNACQSSYDQFYSTEPGVYAYWALCEQGSPAQIHDYVGTWDLTLQSQAWGNGTVSGGAPGPVPDGETASSVASSSSDITNQGMPLDSHQGTIAIWVSGNALAYPLTPIFLEAVGGKSAVSIGLTTANQQLCFNGTLTNTANSASNIQGCGFTPEQWYRVVFTWSNGSLSLYVDGSMVASGSYAGSLDNAIFYYRLFPGCCGFSSTMTIAKAAVANVAWSASDAAADAAPTLAAVPAGGVYVTNQTLGTIHKNVLGYSDNDADLSNGAKLTALQTAITAGGFTALRYANGYGGITADLEDWQTGDACTAQQGAAAGPGIDQSTDNNIDNYMAGVASPLNLATVYTVNYGTNPPYCDAGGAPTVNGADLVTYTNVTHPYGIKYWEIGNEQYSNLTETDFHPNPNTGASYSTYEPAFYNAMKAVDPTIEIAVPVSLADYDWATEFTLPVLANAAYDAIVFHNYPLRDPITDGDTLYPDRVASNLERTHGELLALETALLNQDKDPDSIWVTEWDDEVGGGKWSKQTMGAVVPLFATMELAEYMQAGVQIATWWEQGRTDVCSTLNYDGNGESAYSWWECGDTALAYTGAVTGTAEVQIGLQPGELTPAGRAFQILSESGFVTEGEHMLRTYADPNKAPWLLTYAATHGKSVALILINRDRDNSHVVPVSLAAASSGGTAQQWTYGRAQYDYSQTGNWSVGPVQQTLEPWSGTLQVNLAPWSVNVVIVN
jgi:hypothetical protein